jgi:hypothetical protein
MSRPKSIRKVMSANDVGLTASHQAGMLIPKDPQILSFFPKLDAGEYNPRQHIRFRDEAGQFWEFAFIWYNNALGDRGGTRNEYRLTRMTKFLTGLQLRPGDTLWMERDGDDYTIGAKRQGADDGEAADDGARRADGGQYRLQLTGGWVVVSI